MREVAWAQPLYDADAVLKGPIVANVPACLLKENGNANAYFSVIIDINVILFGKKKYILL